MPRKSFLIPAVLALALAACSDSAQNTGGATGGGTGGQLGGQMPPGAGGGRQLSGIDALRAQFQAVGDRVLFATDSSSLDTEAKNILRKQVAWLNANPTVRILVEGHADERGTREYNLALGDRRATAVRVFLTDNGVAATRLRTISYGKERPVEPSSTDAAWSQNRRGVSVIE
jgi:peptidoglycan-associated lipoprotein